MRLDVAINNVIINLFTIINTKTHASSGSATTAPHSYIIRAFDANPVRAIHRTELVYNAIIH